MRSCPVGHSCFRPGRDRAVAKVWARQLGRRLLPLPIATVAIGMPAGNLQRSKAGSRTPREGGGSATGTPNHPAKGVSAANNPPAMGARRHRQ